jgi:hypothetical protein
MSLSEEPDVELPLIAYSVNAAMRMPIVPAPSQRQWMNETDRRFANRCLPLLIANQSGWFVLSGHNIAVTWDGGPGLESIKVEHLEGAEPYSAGSHFGSGILTWRIPYLFRTTPGFNLLARGPANLPKDGIYPLEGIVETDWTDATFTVNWKMTRANHTVIFEVGEPIAMLVPQVRAELESFRPVIRDITSEPEIFAAYQRWSISRRDFIADLHNPGSAAEKQGWQKHYFHGVSASTARPLEHQSKLALAEFVDEREETRHNT